MTWTPPEEGSEAEPSAADAPAAPPIVHNGPHLGELLVSRGALTSEMLQQALLEQTNSGRRLGEILVEQGIISESELVNALSEQLEWELVDLRRVTPEPHAVVLVAESLVRAHRAAARRPHRRRPRDRGFRTDARRRGRGAAQRASGRACASCSHRRATSNAPSTVRTTR